MFSDVGIPTFWQKKHFTVPEALHALPLSLMNHLCSIRVPPKAAGWKKKMVISKASLKLTLSLKKIC